MELHAHGFYLRRQVGQFLIRHAQNFIQMLLVQKVVVPEILDAEIGAVDENVFHILRFAFERVVVESSVKSRMQVDQIQFLVLTQTQCSRPHALPVDQVVLEHCLDHQPCCVDFVAFDR